MPIAKHGPYSHSCIRANLRICATSLLGDRAATIPVGPEVLYKLRKCHIVAIFVKNALYEFVSASRQRALSVNIAEKRIIIIMETR